MNTSFPDVPFGYAPHYEASYGPGKAIVQDIDILFVGGLYVYAFPVQQCLAAPISGAPLQMFPLALGITTLFAVVSWYGIEKPLLGLTDRVAGLPARKP